MVTKLELLGLQTKKCTGPTELACVWVGVGVSVWRRGNEINCEYADKAQLYVTMPLFFVWQQLNWAKGFFFSPLLSQFVIFPAGCMSQKVYEEVKTSPALVA